MVRPARIELAPAPWQGAVLPLNYGRKTFKPPKIVLEHSRLYLLFEIS